MKRWKSWLAVGCTTFSVALIHSVNPSVADAATFDYQPTTIVMNGKLVLKVQHIVAPDPWDGDKPTSWIPIYYLHDVLHALPGNGHRSGVVSWNGASSTGVLKLTVPSGRVLANAGEPTLQRRSMNISISGGKHTVTVSAPRWTAVDPASHQLTTFAPAYYVMEALRAAGIASTWNGRIWDMTANPDGVPPESSSIESKLEAAVSLWTFLQQHASLQLGFQSQDMTPYTLGSFTDVPSEDEGIIGSLTTASASFHDPYESQSPAFRPVSNTVFGSSETVTEAEMDKVLLNLSGIISNPHVRESVPYGSALALCNATGIRVPGLAPTSPMTSRQYHVWLESLLPMMKGFRKVGRNEYQLIPQWLFVGVEGVGQSEQADTRSFEDLQQVQVTVHPAHNTMTAILPNFSVHSPEAVTVQGAEYSLDGGREWISSPSFASTPIYSSAGTADGGINHAPSKILIRSQANSEVWVTYGATSVQASQSGGVGTGFVYKHGEFFSNL